MNFTFLNFPFPYHVKHHMFFKEKLPRHMLHLVPETKHLPRGECTCSYLRFYCANPYPVRCQGIQLYVSVMHATVWLQWHPFSVTHIYAVSFSLDYKICTLFRALFSQCSLCTANSSGLVNKLTELNKQHLLAKDTRQTSPHHPVVRKYFN